MIALWWQNPLTALIVNLVVSALSFLTPPKAVQAWAKKAIQLMSGPKLPRDSRVSSCSMGSCSSVHFSCSSSLLHDSLRDIWDTLSRETRNKRSERGKIIQIISISTCSSPFHPFERWHTLREMAEGVKHLSEFPFNLNASIHWKWNSPVQRWYCRCDIFIKKKKKGLKQLESFTLVIQSAAPSKAQAKQKY